jgi:hypothetical protein
MAQSGRENPWQLQEDGRPQKKQVTRVLELSVPHPNHWEEPGAGDQVQSPMKII